MNLTSAYISAILTSMDWSTKVNPITLREYVLIKEHNLKLRVEEDQLLIEQSNEGHFTIRYTIPIPKVNNQFFSKLVRLTVDKIIFNHEEKISD